MTETALPETGNRYKVVGLPCAVRFDGYATREIVTHWTDPIDPDDDDSDVIIYEEVEEVDDIEWAYVVMVGDDNRILVEVSEMTRIPDDEEFCITCGSLNCAWHGA